MAWSKIDADFFCTGLALRRAISSNLRVRKLSSFSRSSRTLTFQGQAGEMMRWKRIQQVRHADVSTRRRFMYAFTNLQKGSRGTDSRF